MEDIIGTGKYLFVPGNTIRMETNMATVPANAATLLEIWNPYKNDKNYMVLSVDTSYPNTDAYSIEAKAYKEARNEFILGMGSVILGRPWMCNYTGHADAYVRPHHGWKRGNTPVPY